jgi:hypothetical protein
LLSLTCQCSVNQTCFCIIHSIHSHAWRSTFGPLWTCQLFSSVNGCGLHTHVVALMRVWA